MTPVGCAPLSATRCCQRADLVELRRPGDVVDGAGAGDAPVGGRLVVAVEPPRSGPRSSQSARAAERLEARAWPRAASRLALGRALKRADAVEALQRVLVRDLGMPGDERRVVVRRRRRARARAPRDPRTAGGRRRGARPRVLSRQPLLPELEAPPTRPANVIVCTIPTPARPATGARVLEEGDVRARAARLVRVEQVVDRRVVLVDGLLDHPQIRGRACRSRRFPARPR